MLLSATHPHDSATDTRGPPPTPSPTYPLGGHRALGWAPGLTQQVPAGWLFYIWYWVFLCCSLCLSYPLLPSLGPQDCSLCLHRHRGSAHKFTGTIFLDSLHCVNVQYLFFSFCLTSLSTVSSRFIQDWLTLGLTQMLSLLWLRSVPLCVCTSASLSIHLFMDIYVTSVSQLL